MGRLMQPLGVGIVGTGFAAKLRAESLGADPRSRLVAVVGHDPERTQAFAAEHGMVVADSVADLVMRADVDLVVVCHVNRDHGSAVRQGLMAGKAVVVEYPLSLSVTEATELINLSAQRGIFLHVEHIELLGGVHQAARAQLQRVGGPTYARYCTAVPQTPAPQKWTYHRELFGFPLVGALSRIHRLTNLFGAVHRVSCHLRYGESSPLPPAGFFQQCWCAAQLEFESGLWAEVLYAKGEHTWRSQRWLEVVGDRGALVFDGEEGRFLSAAGEEPLEVASRRGLFGKDTTAVLDAIDLGTPLYVTPQESLYALRVAAAAEKSAQTGTWVTVEG